MFSSVISMLESSLPSVCKSRRDCLPLLTATSSSYDTGIAHERQQYDESDADDDEDSFQCLTFISILE